MSDRKPGIIKRFSSQQKRDVNRFSVRVLSPSKEQFELKDVPFELQYVFKALPESVEKVRTLFERGYGIGIRTIRRTPNTVLQAVDRISEGSQMGVVEPWLTQLIYLEEIPLFTEDELFEQNELGINLFTEAHTILGERFQMKRLVLVDLEAHGIDEADREFLSHMNRVLQPLSSAFLHHRIHADRKPLKIRLTRTLLKVLVLIGPIAHVLELWVRGIGQMFAALADDVTRETADLITLKGSGYTGRQLWKQSQVFLPVVIIAIWLALQVEGFIEKESFFIAGFIFGLVAVSFTVVRLLQTYVRYRTAYTDLEKNSKLPSGHLPSLSVFSYKEIRMSSMRFGLLIGALATPILAGTIFALFPSYTHNGWFLAFIASLEIFIAFLYSGNKIAFDRVLFIKKIKRRM
jgi:hypothetical protein